MERIKTESNDTKAAQPGGIANNEHILRELDEWWKTMLEISTEIKSSELRAKFLELVISASERKNQYAHLLYEKHKVEYETLIESAALKQENEDLKEAIATAQHQFADLQQQREGGAGVPT